MPFRVDKTKAGLYALWNIHKKAYTKVPFKTKQSAITMGKHYIKFRENKESKVVNGNYIYPI
jgi:hypothetical protein